MAQTEGKKKKKHRSKRSKRNRRQSFAALSESSTIPTAMPEIETALNGHERSKSGNKDSFYRLGNATGNTSNTSLESAALLDHR